MMQNELAGESVSTEFEVESVIKSERFKIALRNTFAGHEKFFYFVIDFCFCSLCYSFAHFCFASNAISLIVRF